IKHVVVPGDLPDGKDSTGQPTDHETPEYPDEFVYSVAATDPTHNAIAGFGGLGVLARKGVVFPRHYAPSSVCSPTRAAILTGRHPSDVGVPTNDTGLDAGVFTIADYLKRVGPLDAVSGNPLYHTGIIGKWDLGGGTEQTAKAHQFDEVLSYNAHYRNQFYVATALNCRTSVKKYCTKVDSANPDPAQVPCNSTADCPAWCTPGTCACTEWAAYIGPETLSTPTSAEGEQTRKLCDPDYAGTQTNPLCCSISGVDSADYGSYDFRSKKAADGITDYWNASPSPSACGAYSRGLPKTIGSTGVCYYDTRFYGDTATNFIARNWQKPFFLYLAIHATHWKNKAPTKTVDHYETSHLKAKSPRGKQSSKQFWPVLEEVDAMVGRVLNTIAGFCKSGSAICATCSVDNDCGGGVCEHSLKQKSLVILTADNAHEGSSSSPDYGGLILRGAKATTDEGGLRLGLSAWYDDTSTVVGLGSRTTPDQNDGRYEGGGDTAAIKDAISSHVDIFPTVLQAAGCKPQSDGGYTIKTCSNDYFKPCMTDGDCESGNTCNRNRHLSGHTVLPLLSTKVRDYDESLPHRDVAFAELSDKDPAIVARSGASITDYGAARGVCGAKRWAEPINTGTATSIARERVVGSTKLCGNGGDCITWTNDSNSRATNGKYCVTDQEFINCKDGASSCNVALYPRCNGGTECVGSSCRLVPGLPTVCTPPSWKLLGNGGASAAPHLFDVSTNPGEIQELDFVGS